MKFTFIVLLIFIFLCGCNPKERENALSIRESQIEQKEQELLLKEKTLQLKEEMIKEKEQQFDSTRLDSSGMYNPDLIGQWTVKMTNIETTCSGSAVGDKKTETWVISYQNKNLIVLAMNDNKVERAYTGIYKNNLLTLSENVEDVKEDVVTNITVNLTLLTNTEMEGQRQILRDNDCKIIYSLKMNKQ